jgi:acid phosphatase
VPAFSHIVVIVLENREFGRVVENPLMPIFNDWATRYTLLSQHYAIRHPSLPNYLAMIGGSTFGVESNCTDCFVDAPSLPDLIEASGRTWKAYMEDMPEPCYLGDTTTYVQKHNPFIYFDPIRLDSARCRRSIVPFTQLDADLAANTLPDFVFITPNQCNNAHDCPEKTADIWLGTHVPYLLAYPAIAENGLVVLTWDEGQGDHGCCGMETGGGRIATVLISPLARRGFVDDTPYTLYSLLKTIAAAWRLPYLGEAAKEENALILAPWTPGSEP